MGEGQGQAVHGESKCPEAAQAVPTGSSPLHGALGLLPGGPGGVTGQQELQPCAPQEQPEPRWFPENVRRGLALAAGLWNGCHQRKSPWLCAPVRAGRRAVGAKEAACCRLLQEVFLTYPSRDDIFLLGTGFGPDLALRFLGGRVSLTVWPARRPAPRLGTPLHITAVPICSRFQAQQENPQTPGISDFKSHAVRSQPGTWIPLKGGRPLPQRQPHFFPKGSRS